MDFSSATVNREGAVHGARGGRAPPFFCISSAFADHSAIKKNAGVGAGVFERD